MSQITQTNLEFALNGYGLEDIKEYVENRSPSLNEDERSDLTRLNELLESACEVEDDLNVLETYNIKSGKIIVALKYNIKLDDEDMADMQSLIKLLET